MTCGLCTCTPASVCGHCDGSCQCPPRKHRWQTYDRSGKANSRGRRIGCTCGWVSSVRFWNDQIIELNHHTRSEGE